MRNMSSNKKKALLVAIMIAALVFTYMFGSAAYAEDAAVTYDPAPANSYHFNSTNGFYQDDGVCWINNRNAIEVKPSSGYQASFSPEGEWENTLTINSGNNNASVFIMHNNASTVYKAFDVRVDDGAPYSLIACDGAESDELISNITFETTLVKGINDSITIIAHDEDIMEGPESGVFSIEYYVSDSDLIDESSSESATAQLESKIGSSQWVINYEPLENITVQLKPGNNIVYAKIEDNVGNISYVSSDGIVVQDWGEAQEIGGCKYAVDAGGMTSAVMPASGTAWLKESAGGMSTWYALDNSNDIFKHGDRFHVKWLDEDENTDVWNSDYDRLDDSWRNVIDKNKMMMVSVGVTGDDFEYSGLKGKTNLYVQLPDGWNKDEIKAVCVIDGTDEAIHISSESIDYPEGSGNFGVLELTHFSTYIILTNIQKLKKQQIRQTMDLQAAMQEELKCSRPVIQMIMVALIKQVIRKIRS